MTTAVPSITALPTAPDPADRSTFNTRAYPWSAALPAFGTQVGAVADSAYENAIAATAQVTLAAAQALTSSNAAVSASSAALHAGAVVWVSGLTYAAGDTRYSPIDYMTYRRKVTGAGTTDPSADPANWASFASGFATLSGAESFTNKRISAYAYVDRIVTNAAATGTVTLDLSTGSTFDLTLTGNTTLAISNAPALSGEVLSIFVSVTQGATAYSLTWFGGITWITAGGIEPSAPAANKVLEYVLTTKAPGAYKGRKGAAT